VGGLESETTRTIRFDQQVARGLFFFKTTRARFTGQRKAVVHKTMIANEAC